MEVVTKIITVMGALVAIGGLGWAFVGAIEFFQERKTKMHNKPITEWQVWFMVAD